MECPPFLGTQTSVAFVDRRVEAWGAPMSAKRSASATHCRTRWLKSLSTACLLALWASSTAPRRFTSSVAPATRSSSALTCSTPARRPTPRTSPARTPSKQPRKPRKPPLPTRRNAPLSKRLSVPNRSTPPSSPSTSPKSTSPQPSTNRQNVSTNLGRSGHHLTI